MTTIDADVLAGLRASVGGDDAFVVDLVETYLTDAAAQLAAIDRAVSSGDAESLVRPAHTLKTSSLTIGATRLGELSRALEMTGRSSNLAEAQAQATAVHDEWSRVEPELRAWLSSQGAG